MKLNNKGFAITAVLYGLLILFVFLVGSYLTVLTAKKNRVDKITSEIEDVGIPGDYIKLSYIESEGTQYIDTGLTMEKTDSVKITFRANFTNNSYGGGNGYTQFTANVANNSNTNVVIDYNGATKEEKVYVNEMLDESRSKDWTNGYSGTNVKIGIFKLGNAGNAWYTDDSTTQIGKLYEEKIEKNNKVVRNFIPCYSKNEKVAGLYDLVTKEFYKSENDNFKYSEDEVNE